MVHAKTPVDKLRSALACAKLRLGSSQILFWLAKYELEARQNPSSPSLGGFSLLLCPETNTRTLCCASKHMVEGF